MWSREKEIGTWDSENRPPPPLVPLRLCGQQVSGRGWRATWPHVMSFSFLFSFSLFPMLADAALSPPLFFPRLTQQSPQRRRRDEFHISLHSYLPPLFREA